MTKYEYKCVRIKKNGLCKLIMNVCKKNVVLPREWAGIVVGIWSHAGQGLSYTFDIWKGRERLAPNLSPEELVGMFFNLVESSESRKSFASLPYIKGVTEPLTRVLKKYDISVTNKPMNTLQQQFPAPKFRPAPDLQTNVVYKIPCANCSWCYIGETGRAFNTRRKEHLRNVKTAAKGSRIANHVWSHDHSIDFNNASVIDKGSFRTRKTLESWHSMVTPNADNNSCPLPGQYNILFTHIHN